MKIKAITEVIDKIIESDIRMDKNSHFGKGSKIIEDGKVYIIYKVVLKRTTSGFEKIIHYRPFYSNHKNSTILCSIPQNLLAASSIRKPVTKKEVGDILSYLSVQEDFKKIDIIEESKNFKLNSILETTRVLKLGLTNQKLKGQNFNITKNGIVKNAVYYMVEEVALVLNITIEAAKNKINLASKIFYSTVETT